MSMSLKFAQLLFDKKSRKPGNYFEELGDRLFFQALYIKKNNKNESMGNIASKFFSYYYGNGYKLADYLKTLSFPKEDWRKVEVIIDFCQKNKRCFILDFYNVVKYISNDFQYYLSDDEYKFHVVHNALIEFNSSQKLTHKTDSFFMNETYTNLYDCEILDSSCQFSGIYFDECGLGRRLKQCCEAIRPFIIERKNITYNDPDSISKEFDLNCRIEAIIEHKFPDLKKQNGRII